MSSASTMLTPTFDQLVTAARLLSEQNTHGVTVREYDGRMMFDGSHILTINGTVQFRIDADGTVVAS